jgi:hypothetical protein
LPGAHRQFWQRSVSGGCRRTAKTIARSCYDETFLKQSAAARLPG